MKTQLFLLAALCATLPCAGQSAKLSDWTKLIDSNQCKAAETLCTKFANSASLAEKVEAQKCLANAALCGSEVLQLEGDDAGGGTLRGGYTREAADDALAHLDLALKLAPQDITIHEGRLHILEVAGRYADMVKALDESCDIYKGGGAPDVWLAYAGELNDLRQYNTALEFMQVLNKHYPNNPDITGNIGAFLLLLNRSSEGIPYLKRAVELAPFDPINSWDLDRAYDNTDQIALADRWYQKGLSLMTDPEQRKQNLCIYGQFVETKLKDRSRGCTLEKTNCDADQPSPCAVPKKPTRP